MPPSIKAKSTYRPLPKIANAKTEVTLCQLYAMSDDLLSNGEHSSTLDRLWQIIKALDGHFGHALYLSCLDANVPEEVAGEAIRDIGQG